MHFLKGSSFSFWRRRLALAALLSAFALPVFAADVDPFNNVEQNQWMSFDRFSDKAKTPQPAEQQTPPDIADVDMTAKPDSAATASTAGAAPAQTAPEATAIAQPTRPLNPPLLPGINKGYAVRVDTTADDDKKIAILLSDANNQPAMQIQNTDWQDAAEAARNEAQAQAAKDNPDHVTLKIRMSYLPDSKIAPTEPATRKKMNGRAAAKAELAAPIVTSSAGPMPKANMAACAAINAYKKQQLAAIESDRQTLAALQNAIADLGLQKQLSFMTDAKGSITPQMIDYPAGAQANAGRN